MPVPFQARTERDLKRPGYCAISHMRTFLAYAASGHVHAGDEITAKRLNVELEIPRQEQYLVLATQRHLGFIDEGKRITSTLEELVQATGEDYRHKWVTVLKDSYPEIFRSGLDLAYATPVELKKAFAACNFEPVDMQLKMVALFRGLCRMAGIIQVEGIEAQTTNGHNADSTPSLSSVNAVPLALAKDTPMQTPSRFNGLHHAQTDFASVRKVVASFARLDQIAENAGSSEANLALWMDYVRMSYDLLGVALAQAEETKQ